MAQLQGRATIKRDGVSFVTANGATLMFGGRPREAVSDDQGRIHYREGETTPGGVRCTVLVDADFRQANVNGADLTVEFVADTGQTYVINEAFLVTPIELSNGQVEVEYQGQPAVEV